MIDHLVLAVPDLAETCATLIKEWGAVIAKGGSHPHHGTHNALLRLGKRQYLEILAADPAVPDQQRSDRGRRIAAFGRPNLMEVIFAVPKTVDSFLLDLPSGIEIDTDAEGRRLRADGTEVKWRLLGLRHPDLGRLPDMIEWLSPHPSLELVDGAALQQLCLLHPKADMLAECLSQFGGHDPLLKVSPGQGLAAEIKFPKGTWQLTGPQ